VPANSFDVPQSAARQVPDGGWHGQIGRDGEGTGISEGLPSSVQVRGSPGGCWVGPGRGGAARRGQVRGEPIAGSLGDRCELVPFGLTAGRGNDQQAHDSRNRPLRRSVWQVQEGPLHPAQVRPEPNAASSMALVGRGWLRRLIPCCNAVSANFLPLRVPRIPREARKPSGRRPPLAFRSSGCSGRKPLP